MRANFYAKQDARHKAHAIKFAATLPPIAPTIAQQELARVAPLHTFNVGAATRKRRINQHLTAYYFADGSRLEVNVTVMVGKAFDATGQRLERCAVKVNKNGSK